MTDEPIKEDKMSLEERLAVLNEAIESLKDEDDESSLGSFVNEEIQSTLAEYYALLDDDCE